MIKAVIFDSDGMITYDPIFSKTYSEKYGISIDLINPFFEGPFKDCLVGKADLHMELENGWLEKWGWKGSIQEFLDYWFSVGGSPNTRILSTITKLRENGITCVLATNQEKYRAEYMISTFNYQQIFDTVFVSASVGYKKPYTDFFGAIFEHLQRIQPSLGKDEVLFWDDDIKNVQGAQNYGFLSEQYTEVDDYIEKMQSYNLPIK